MKRRHGINTSHTKHLSQSQQQLQEQPQPEQSQIDQSNAEQSLSISNTESSTVHVRNYNLI